MKPKKALKPLNKVELMPFNVIDGCPTSARGLRDASKVVSPLKKGRIGRGPAQGA
jgi:hypothetical protein